MSILVCSPPIVGQHLDWSSDVTIFGTPLDERNPELVAAATGNLLRALCLRADSVICMKTSTDNGVSWSASSNRTLPSGTPFMGATADRDFHYIAVCELPATRRIFRLASEDADWDSAIQVVIAPSHTLPVVSLSLASDFEFQPGAPYVNVCWAERSNAGLDETICFTQSRDQGRTFLAEHSVHAQSVSAASGSELSLAAAWQFDHERVIVAVAVDRAGSVPEEIRVYTSEDQGNSWSSGIIIDSTAAEQRDPRAAAYEMTVLVVYERRATPGAPRDIVYAYSPDGGLSFSPLLTVADSRLDESAAKVTIDGAHNEFAFVYLVKDSASDTASVVLRSGHLSTPWVLSPPQVVGEFADVHGGLAAAQCGQGVAAAWASHFATGDLDVRFDASWRGAGSTTRMSLLPDRAELGPVFPNPFNSEAALTVTLRQGASLSFVVRDILGRRAVNVTPGYLAVGKHLVHFDLHSLPSGMYTVSLGNSPAQVQKMVLIR